MAVVVQNTKEDPKDLLDKVNYICNQGFGEELLEKLTEELRSLESCTKKDVCTFMDVSIVHATGRLQLSPQVTGLISNEIIELLQRVRDNAHSNTDSARYDLALLNLYQLRMSIETRPEQIITARTAKIIVAILQENLSVKMCNDYVDDMIHHVHDCLIDFDSLFDPEELFYEIDDIPLPLGPTPCRIGLVELDEDYRNQWTTWVMPERDFVGDLYKEAEVRNNFIPSPP